MMMLKDVRESAGLTQRELARLACVSRAAVSHVETGRFTPSARFAGKVCRALGVALGCVIYTWQVFPEQFRAIPAAVEAPAAPAPEAGGAGDGGAGRGRVWAPDSRAPQEVKA